MGRMVNFVYGGILIYIALDVLVPFLHFIPEEFLQYVLIVMGVLILLTPAGAAGMTPIFQKLRKWVFGIFLVAMGLLSAIGSFGQFFQNITIYSTTGPWILLGIGVIYFLSAFKQTSGIRIRSI